MCRAVNKLAAYKLHDDVTSVTPDFPIHVFFSVHSADKTPIMKKRVFYEDDRPGLSRARWKRSGGGTLRVKETSVNYDSSNWQKAAEEMSKMQSHVPQNKVIKVDRSFNVYWPTGVTPKM